MKTFISALIVLCMIASVGLFNEGKRKTQIAIILLFITFILIVTLNSL